MGGQIAPHFYPLEANPAKETSNFGLPARSCHSASPAACRWSGTTFRACVVHLKVAEIKIRDKQNNTINRRHGEVKITSFIKPCGSGVIGPSAVWATFGVNSLRTVWRYGCDSVHFYFSAMKREDISDSEKSTSLLFFQFIFILNRLALLGYSKYPFFDPTMHVTIFIDICMSKCRTCACACITALLCMRCMYNACGICGVKNSIFVSRIYVLLLCIFIYVVHNKLCILHLRHFVFHSTCVEWT